MKPLRSELNILLIEDDVGFRTEVKKLLGVYNEIDGVGSISEARAIIKAKRHDVIILDKNLPDGNGLDLIPEIKAENSDAVVIVVTGDSDFNLVNKCISSGASDYVVKSENIIPDLLVRIPLAMSRVALERRSSSLEGLFKEAFKYEIVGHSPAMVELRKTIQDLKGSRSPVLIIGETGTGKELIARGLNAIDTPDGRCRPFVALNCGAIPETLIETELFGHVRGAFTDARMDRPGKFEEANGGDIFLDEIGELPLQMQSKLLRVLQEGEVSRVGSNKVIRINVRIIAATNKPLEEMIKEKTFREDLFYRLNVYQISTEPLRNRPEDIPDLAKFFVVKLGGPKISISEDAIKYLSKLQWPGNIRELHNCIERALLVIKRRGSFVIEKQDLIGKGAPGSLSLRLTVSGVTLPKLKSEVTPEAFKKYVEAAEKDFIKTTVDLFDGNATEAARYLGLARSTMFSKLREYGLSKNIKKESYEISSKESARGQ